MNYIFKKDIKQNVIKHIFEIRVITEYDKLNFKNKNNKDMINYI